MPKLLIWMVLPTIALLTPGCAQIQSLPDKLGLNDSSPEGELVRQVRTPEGIMLVVRDILFETDKADLRPEAEPILDKALEILEHYPERNVLIAGHADSRGSEEYNRTLSRRRAETVREALRNRGVAEQRIVLRDYGETHPVADNATEEGRQKNRRVEIIILNPGALLEQVDL